MLFTASLTAFFSQTSLLFEARELKTFVQLRDQTQAPHFQISLGSRLELGPSTNSFQSFSLGTNLSLAMMLGSPLRNLPLGIVFSIDPIL